MSYFYFLKLLLVITLLFLILKQITLFLIIKTSSGGNRFYISDRQIKFLRPVIIPRIIKQNNTYGNLCAMNRKLFLVKLFNVHTI